MVGKFFQPASVAPKKNPARGRVGALPGAGPLLPAAFHLSIDDGVDKGLGHFNEVNDCPPGAIV